MKKSLFIFLIPLLSACGGASSCSDTSIEENNTSEVIVSSSDGGVLPPTEDTTPIADDNLATLNNDAKVLLSSYVNLSLTKFYDDFESEQQTIAANMSALGRLSSGDHIIAIQNLFKAMIAEYKIRLLDIILAIHSNGYLKAEAVDNEIKAVKQNFQSYIDNDVLTDYNNYQSQNVLNILSSDLHKTLEDTYTLLVLELQNFGVL